MAITCVGLAPIARLEHRRPSRATGNAHLQTVSRMTACRVTSISRAVRQGERTGETKGLLTAAVSQWRCHHRRGGLPSGKPSAAAAARSVRRPRRVDLELDLSHFYGAWFRATRATGAAATKATKAALLRARCAGPPSAQAAAGRPGARAGAGSARAVQRAVARCAGEARPRTRPMKRVARTRIVTNRNRGRAKPGPERRRPYWQQQL